MNVCGPGEGVRPTCQRKRKSHVEAWGYSFPNGTNTVGRHGHGTKKHGPGPARPGLLRARAWHGPATVPCLGCHLGPLARPRHGTANRPARPWHGSSKGYKPAPPAAPYRRNPSSFVSSSLSLLSLALTSASGSLLSSSPSPVVSPLFFSPSGGILVVHLVVSFVTVVDLAGPPATLVLRMSVS